MPFVPDNQQGRFVPDSPRQFIGPTEDQARRPMTRTEAALRAFTTGAWFGAGPGVAAAARMADDRDAPMSQQTMNPNVYRDQLQHERERLNTGRQAYPYTSAASEITGAITSGMSLPAARTVLGNVGQGAAVGGTYGYNASQSPTVAGQFKDAATGAALGGVTSGLGAAIASRVARARTPKAPTIDQIKAAKDIAYNAADASTDVVPLDRIRQLIPKVQESLRSEGYRPGVHPMAKEALQALQDEVADPAVYGQTLKGVETLRRQLIQAEQSAGSRGDAFMAGKVLDSFDDFMDELAPYKDARSLYHTLRKAQDIEALFEKAQNAAGGYTQSGFENTLRAQFRSLADNPRRFNRFNAEEKAAILKVVRGGPVQSFVRFMGKFAARGPVSAMATGMLGNLAGGPGGAIALGALGEGSRAIAGGMRTGAANRVSELVRSGAPISVATGSAQIPQIGYLPSAVVPARNALAPEEYRNALTR